MRVFITGLSALTACGETADKTWDSLKQGADGLGDMQRWNIDGWATRRVGELKDEQYTKLLPDRKLIKVLSKQDIMGINAAVQAVNHSDLLAYRDTLPCAQQFNEETGIFVSSPGNKYFQQYDFLPLLAKSQGEMKPFADSLFDEVHPMWLLRILPNNVLAYAGIAYGFKGPNQNITNHAAGSIQAILEAYHAIRLGQIKRALIVGYDITEPQGLFYYNNLGLISSNHLKPFDQEHDGTILAEGAAALVLESDEAVLERSATCYAEIKGGLSANEMAGPFGLKHNGEPLAELIHTTLKQTNLNPEAIDFIVAHGNGNPASDDSEAAALTAVFSKISPPITAFKWAMGHTISASGIVDTVLATYAFRKKILPGIPNLGTPSSAAASLNLSNQLRPLHQSKSALVINRGFGSMNACLVLNACDA